MQTISISLPDQLKDYIDSEVGSGRYDSASGYIRDLVSDDGKRKAQVHLERY